MYKQWLVLAYLEIPAEFPQARSIFTILGVYPTQLILLQTFLKHTNNNLKTNEKN